MVVGDTEQPALSEHTLVASLQTHPTHAAPEAGQVVHRLPSLHHQLGGADDLLTALTAHRKQPTEEWNGLCR